MQAVGKTYDYVIYDDAGHGFIRSGEGENPASGNQQARAEAIERLKEILSSI
jgi:carboxymethylenebutenolidase